MLSLSQLRLKHPRLTYHSVDLEWHSKTLKLTFSYLLHPDIPFQTTLELPLPENLQLNDQEKMLVREWAFQIGMVELLSYWKVACPQVIEVTAGNLTKGQLLFWDQLLKKGLSEFFFVNNINAWEDGFVEYVVREPENAIELDSQTHLAEILLPLGGGKDSIVSLELLKSQEIPVTGVVLNPSDRMQQVVELSGLETTLTLTRKLDPRLLELNKQGYLNGHTPFSAMLAFTTTLLAYLQNKRWVVVSNEWSANEGNTLFLGQSINHQYSKSVEFETLFRQYLKENLSGTVEYFSFLRPLHELQIAKLFAKSEKFFPVFLSCNRGQREGRWCGECPKCLFVFLMLSAFLPIPEVTTIFNKNLFEDIHLKPIFDELTGMVEVKSLECVGTRDESLAALQLILKKTDKPLPVLLEYAEKEVLRKANLSQAQPEKLLADWQDQNYIPPEFAALLQDAIRK